MKRWLATAVAAVALGVGGWVGTASAADSPYCGIRWGSLAKQAAPTGSSQLTGVRAGQHACFDRLVLDLSGRGGFYDVRYVDQVRQDGSGFVVPLRGGARLQIVSAAAYDANGRPTYRPARPTELVGVAGWRTFRQVAYAGSFEGHSTTGLGVRARLPFRVFTVDGPGAGSRLVIDVAHRW